MKIKTIITTLYSAWFCKHKTRDVVSCALTEKTYETCNDCGKLTLVMRTHS